jgi:hypothetical protein
VVSSVSNKRVREGNGKGWMDQCKAHPQWRYIEKPLWTST